MHITKPLYLGSLFERKYRGFYLFGGCQPSMAAYVLSEQMVLGPVGHVPFLDLEIGIRIQAHPAAEEVAA